MTVTGWTADLEGYFARMASTYDRVGDEPFWRFSDALLWRHITIWPAERPIQVLDAGGGTARWSARVLSHFTAAVGKVVDLRDFGADAGTRTRNLPITSRVRYQLRHAGNVS
jgi:ubiquinone/menaquinone biosynthesis C-methylase UbiE